MSKGGLVPHIDGVSDEYVNAAFIAGTIYLGWQLIKRAGTKSTQPPASGPPATTLPAPPGGHLDAVAPPPAVGGRGGPSLIYHNPAPVAQRDYYGAGPAAAPPSWLDHGTGITQMLGAGQALAAAAVAASYGPPLAPGGVIQAGPLAGVTQQGPSPAAHPKIIGSKPPAPKRAAGQGMPNTNPARDARTMETSAGSRAGRPGGVQY